jgi:hypothetical protein
VGALDQSNRFHLIGSILQHNARFRDNGCRF